MIFWKRRCVRLSDVYKVYRLGSDQYNTRMLSRMISTYYKFRSPKSVSVIFIANRPTVKFIWFRPYIKTLHWSSLTITYRAFVMRGGMWACWTYYVIKEQQFNSQVVLHHYGNMQIFWPYHQLWLLLMLLCKVIMNNTSMTASTVKV